MKNKISIILFALFLVGCFGSSPPPKPSRTDPDGFRNIKWGTELSTLNDMEKVEGGQSPNRDLVWYTRKGDILNIGQAKLENIFYSFWMGKFESVWIDFEGDRNLEVLKKELIERLGKVRGGEEPEEKAQRETGREPSAMKRQGGFYAWWGNYTETVLSYSKDRRKGTLTVSSTKVGEERREYEKQKEKGL